MNAIGLLVGLCTLHSWAIAATSMAFVLPEIRAVAPSAELIAEYQRRSYPPDVVRVSLLNPWGEAIEYLDAMPANFAPRVLAAAEMYARQHIRFDGYVGGDSDGEQYERAADGEDGAFYARPGGVRAVYNGTPDDMDERAWVCADLILHAYSMAGFPIREAILLDYDRSPYVYTLGGAFPENEPMTVHFFRRIRNIEMYFKHRQVYSEQRITAKQYRDPGFLPADRFRPGDVVFFGHYHDEDEGEQGLWRAQHAGIVATVDKRGLPDRIYNMRVSVGMEDRYDGLMDQTRSINGDPVYFRRFSDRYSLIGFGRIVNWPESIPTSTEAYVTAE